MAAKETCYAKFLLIGFALVLGIMNIGWLVTQLVWYSGCDIGTMVLVITTIFFIFFYAVAFTLECGCKWFREEANLFVVGFCTTYIVYLSWTALASYPDVDCNEYITSGVNTFFQIFIGTIFTFTNIWCIAIASASPNAGEGH